MTHKQKSEAVKKWLDKNALSFSHQHTKEPHIIEMKNNIVRHETREAWEAGRACGFNAGLKIGFEQGVDFVSKKNNDVTEQTD